MLQELLKLYAAAMASGVTSPMPHYVGPPGSGKSSVFQQAADLIGCTLHIINVSRINPLDLEGLELPSEKERALELHLSSRWASLRDGDIVLFDEFLRGFPEVYNGLLDIFTSRQVAGHKLPNVFIAGASNTTVTYDSALNDRLLHIPVPDPRKKASLRDALVERFINEVGLYPDFNVRVAALTMFNTEVLDMYNMIDNYLGAGKKRSVAAGGSAEGTSLRNLAGQVRLRHLVTPTLKEVVETSNTRAMTDKHYQYVIICDPAHAPKGYVEKAEQILDSPQLTELQRQNILLNLQLIQAHQALTTTDGGTTDDE